MCIVDRVQVECVDWITNKCWRSRIFLRDTSFFTLILHPLKQIMRVPMVQSWHDERKVSNWVPQSWYNSTVSSNKKILTTKEDDGCVEMDLDAWPIREWGRIFKANMKVVDYDIYKAREQDDGHDIGITSWEGNMVLVINTLLKGWVHLNLVSCHFALVRTWELLETSTIWRFETCWKCRMPEDLCMVRIFWFELVVI